MKRIISDIFIHATQKTVWDVLMDFESYPEWNPFIKSISGEQVKGGKLEVTIESPGHKAMDFSPKIIVLDEHKEFRWMGRFIMPGMFDGEHYFKLEPVSDNQVRFIHGEKFGGILTIFLSKMLIDTERGFEMMNEALKQRCEEMEVKP